jgi:hypothetical protein
MKAAFSEEDKRKRHEENMHVRSGNVRTEFETVDGKSFSLVCPQNLFVVYSLSSTQIPPLCTDVTRPGLCVHRCFQDQEDAQEFSKHLAQQHPEISILLSPTHKWLLGATSFEQLQTSSETVDAILIHNQEAAKASKKAFEEYCQKGSGDSAPKHSAAPATKKRTDNRQKWFQENKIRCRTNLQVAPDQQFAVLVVVPDTRPADGGMYAFKVLRCFEDESDADAYIRNTAGRMYTTHDLVVFRCCQWTSIDLTNSKVAHKYRDPNLQKMLDYGQNQKTEVDNYREYCKANNLEFDVQEIGGDAAQRESLSAEPEPEPEPEPTEPEPEPPESEPRRSKRLSKQ